MTPTYHRLLSRGQREKDKCHCCYSNLPGCFLGTPMLLGALYSTIYDSIIDKSNASVLYVKCKFLWLTSISTRYKSTVCTHRGVNHSRVCHCVQGDSGAEKLAAEQFITEVKVLTRSVTAQAPWQYDKTVICPM